MTIPKPTNEMAMVHLDGWTDGLTGLTPERFPCDLVFLQVQVGDAQTKDGQSHFERNPEQS